MSEIIKKEEMDKAELVYVMSLMLDCIGFEAQLNKLSKPCLFRVYDDLHARGNAYANVQEHLSTSEQKAIQLQGEVDILTKKNDMLTNKLRAEVRKSNKRNGSRYDG